MSTSSSFKLYILTSMRYFVVLLLMLAACSSSQESAEFETVEQAYIGPPKPPITCDESLVLCGIDCVDISRDNRNCGDCGQVCRVADGEFCLAYYCRNVRNFGFTLEPQGPREYDIRRDLPRPPPTWGEEK